MKKVIDWFQRYRRNKKMKTIQLSSMASNDIVLDPRLAEGAFQEIVGCIRNGEKVAISFKDTKIVITAFLQVLIGKLFDPTLGIADKVDNMLVIEDASDDNKERVEQVKKYARMFYEDPARLDRILAED